MTIIEDCAVCITHSHLTRSLQSGQHLTFSMLDDILLLFVDWLVPECMVYLKVAAHARATHCSCCDFLLEAAHL